MYDYLKGKIIEITPTKIILDVNGIGYKILIGLNTFQKLQKPTSSTCLFISFIVREDAHLLFGFLQKQERDFFDITITVSGIGPKTALALLGHVDFQHLMQAISTADIRLISKVPGIGKKTAERLIIEMRDKLKILDKQMISSTDKNSIDHSNTYDAIQALMNLGYSAMQAQKAINAVMEKQPKDTAIDTGKLITLALKTI